MLVTALNGVKGYLLKADYFNKPRPIKEQIKEVFKTKEAKDIVIDTEELLRKIEVNALAETQLKETVEKLKKRAELEKQLAALD